MKRSLFYKVKKDKYVYVKNHFAKSPFLITSRRFCESEHVKPVPSGSTRTFFTILSSISNAYLKKKRMYSDLFLRKYTEMIEHCLRQLSDLFQDQEPKNDLKR